VSHTITFEVDVDEEQLNKLVEPDFTGIKNGELVGDATIDAGKIRTEVINGISLAESTAPDAVAIALDSQLE